MDKSGILLSTKQIITNASFLRTTPMVYMCRNMIQHYLFCNGITFSHRRGRIRPDPHMQEIMNDYWLPFCKDMTDSILTMGIVVVRLINMQDGLTVPVVLEPGCCSIKMLYSYGVREYVALDEQNQEIPDTIVLDCFGHSPTSNGALTSVISNLMPEIQYMNIMRGTTLTMEQKRSNPVIITETVDTKTDKVEGIQYDYYADGDMQDNSDRNKFTRNKSSVEQLAYQQQLYDNFFAGGAPTSVGGNVLDNVVNLPLGQKIVNVAQQTGRGDIVAQTKSFQDIVCGVMGVPRSLLMSDTPHKSDAEGTHQTFHKTVLWWKNKLQNACERIYNIVYAEDIKSQLMNAMGKKRKRDTSIADVYVLKKRLEVQVIFPVSPFMSNDELYAHYQRGVIPWDTYVEHACANVSLPHVPQPEPIKQNESDSQPDTNDQADTDDKKKKEKDDKDKKDDKADKKESKDKKDK